MKILKKIKNRIVYALTDKPTCYVHVDKPKTLQDMRQVQYNNWCKAKGVYNGSYLPANHQDLTKKGWTDVTHPNIAGTDKQQYIRKSTWQRVDHHDDRYDEYGQLEKEHYHWLNTQKPAPRNTRGDKLKMFDRYGRPCKSRTPESHIGALDSDYVCNKHKHQG